MGSLDGFAWYGLDGFSIQWLTHEAGARIVNVTSEMEDCPHCYDDYIEDLDAEDESPFTAALYGGIPASPPPGPPKCEMCGCNPWILTAHPISGKRVCLECKTKGCEGYVACPNTPAHKDGKCVLCRNTPGYIQEA